MPLREHFRRLIAATGPIPVSRYMADALGHPEHGYYARREPFGTRGDFVTAPEISQIFGELIGLWAVACWQQMGAPGRVVLAEAGPGRGTLMADALRAARLAPDFLAAADVVLIETSPRLRELQRQALPPLARPARWIDRVDALPEGPLLFLANEFFDALPIRQFERHDGAWWERMVGWREEALCFLRAPDPAGPGLIPEVLRQAPDGALVESREADRAIATLLGEHLSRHGGYGLIIDYGHARSAPGDSLQAVRGHAYHAVLEDPGLADLTAHVDFQQLAEAATDGGALSHGPLGQGDFLRRLGLDARAERLKRDADPRQRTAIDTACRRLTADDQMGSLFKVLALAGPMQPPPPGF